MLKFGSKVAYRKQRASSARGGAEYDHLLKFLLVGDSGTGKSCLIMRWADGAYFNESYITTIGVDFKIRTTDIDGRRVKCQVWDTTGQERFRTLTSSYYRGAHGVVLVYDVTDRDSFLHLQRWREEVARYSAEGVRMVVAGNKADTGPDARRVTREEAEAWCQSAGLDHTEVSAKTGMGVEEAFDRVGRHCMARVDASSPPPVSAALRMSSENSKVPGGFFARVLSALAPSPSPAPPSATSDGPPAPGGGDVSSDEEEFSEQELEADLRAVGLGGKGATVTARAKPRTTRQRHKHFKTGTNVCRLQLQTLTHTTAVMPCAAVVCPGCSAVLSTASTVSAQRPAPPETPLGPQPVAGDTTNGDHTGDHTVDHAGAAPPAKHSVEDGKGDTAGRQGDEGVATTEAEVVVEEEGVAAGPGGPPGGAPLPQQAEAEAEEELWWTCDFCDCIVPLGPTRRRDIPTDDTVDYVLEPPTVANEEENSVTTTTEADQTIIFVIDVSGSMCVTTEVGGREAQLRAAQHRRQELSAELLRGAGDQYLPGQRRHTSFVSRLDCVKAAVEAQIVRIASESPSARVGLVTFSNTVRILGDGAQPEVVVDGTALHSWPDLVTIGDTYKVATAVSASKDSLLRALWGLKESGRTALGPALHVAVGLAAAHSMLDTGHSIPGRVVLCTDGKANVGLGNIEGSETKYSPYYTELAERAKTKGVSVSVVSFTGTACALENLAVVAAETGGEVTRVDPGWTQLAGEFSSVLNNPVLATGCFAVVLLHRGLRFRGELDDEEDPTRNWLVRDIGNVTAATEACFSYGFRPKDQCDLQAHRDVPFQVQVTYNKPGGGKYLRVVTERIPLTDERTEAEAAADVKVIGSYAAQKAARYAREGNYEEAQMEARAADRFLTRTNKVAAPELDVWRSNIGAMDRALRDVRSSEAVSGTSGPSHGKASSASGKARKAKRSGLDNVSEAIYKQQSAPSAKLWSS